MVYDVLFYRKMKLTVMVFNNLVLGIQMVTFNLICVLVSLFAGGLLQGEIDWPTFRGPQGNGVAVGSAPVSWNADARDGEIEGVLWQVDVPGLGHSSPVISGDRIFLVTAIASDGKAPLKVGPGGRPEAAEDNGEQSWLLICYDKHTGKEIWRRTAHRGIPRATRHAKATHANTSVVVSGDCVVAFFGSEGIYCYDFEGGLRWSRDLGVINISKYGIGWGYASSPAVYSDRVALVCDDPAKPFLVLLNLKDGKEVWRVSRENICERNWSTPFIHSEPERTQVVVNGWPWVVSYDLKTGQEFWRIRGGGDNPVPTPFEANGWIYLTSAHGGLSPIYVVRPDATGDISPAEDKSSNKGMVWSTPRGGCYMSTPVVCGDYLILGNSNGVVRCFHAVTGERLYEKRLGANAGIISSLVVADDRVYCASENGTVYVLEVGPEFKLLAENRMGQPCFATPAISNGVIFVRTTEKLVAIQ